MSAPTELTKGNAAGLILSCLAKEPMHGYRIAKYIAEESDGYFTMGEGTLYHHLHTLEREGMVEGYWETVSGSRERKYYRLTEKGKAELARKRAEWNQFQSNVSKLLGSQ